MWLIAIAVLIALAASGGEAPPPPDAPPRCAELVITPEWLQERKLKFFSFATVDPNEPAVPFLIRAMQALTPDCDWTPSTTTEIVRPDGTRVRFDVILRELQGLTVGQALTKLNAATGGLEGASPRTFVELAIGVSVDAGPVIEPPVPTPPKPPIPTPDGAGGPTQTPDSLTACDRTFSDGPASVCLMRLSATKWHWTWTSPDGAKLEGDAPNAGVGRILAYQQAAKTQQVAYVVPEIIARSGARLSPNGDLAVYDSITWALATVKRLRVQWSQGERDPMGIILSVFQLVFPSANWFRISPVGGIEAARQRVQIAVTQFQNSPDVADRLALAIVGAQWDPLDHVWRGQRVRIRETTDVVNGNEVHRWQYKLDDRPWVGSYATQAEATTAAHGV